MFFELYLLVCGIILTIVYNRGDYEASTIEGSIKSLLAA